MKIRKDDRVQVIAGKDVGAEGRVLEVLPRKGRVIVEGVNRVTRHEKVKMNRRGGQEGGIAHKEAAIDISNVAILCPTDGPTRIGYRIEEGTGAKVRICRKCGTEL
ncbi:MAG TPA: 50S ribosomal protein L24 [Actinomycetota bacterium]|nr:50S ribosomal protein L24 [Actinomycetota bacterium]